MDEQVRELRSKRLAILAGRKSSELSPEELQQISNLNREFLRKAMEPMFQGLAQSVAGKPSPKE